jgi:hypothetical protein
VQELKNPSRVRRKDKLRRTSAFTHKVITARSAEVTEPFDSSEYPKLRRVSIFIRAAKLKV